MIIRVWREHDDLRATMTATHDVIAGQTPKPEYFSNDTDVLDAVRRWLAGT